MTGRRNIAGTLGLAELAALTGRETYEQRANQDRPSDASAVVAEIRRLHRRGHSAAYIAEALHVEPDMVEKALAEQTPG